MSNIIFVGDVHLKGSTPISRKDNYPEVILNKINFIRDYADKIGCTTVIFLGDIFDTVNTSLQYFSHVLTTFKQFKDMGVDLYTIVGNHDLRYDSLETLPITPLGVLVKTGAINILDSLIVDDTFIRGCHYPDSPEPNTSDSLYAIIVLHRFYESGFNETPISKAEAIELDYNACIMGHDHRPYETVNIEKGNKIIQILRPGSLARNTSDQYNRLRKPRILIFNTEDHSYRYEEVPSTPGLEVFFEREADKKNVSMGELVEYLRSSYHTADTSIREYVSCVDMPENVRSIITTYLNILGA